MKRFVVVLISVFGTLLILYAVFIAAVDPFYIFHMPIAGMEPVQTDMAHYVARGLIRNADYEMLICGSSMCENFHIDDANKIFYEGKDKCLKVVQHGSYSNDLRASLETAAETDKADVIIMALDINIFGKPDEGYATQNIPAYAIEKPTIVNCWSYLLNKDILRYAVDLIVQNMSDNIQSQNNWWCISDDTYSKKNLLVAYKNNTVKFGFDSEKAWNNLKNIQIGVEACQQKGIKIQFFIPPYSIAWWDGRDYEEELITYKELWRELLKFSNVSIFATQFDQDIITNLDNYRNLNHYNKDVSNKILQYINDDKYKLTMNNIDNEVDEFIKILNKYDWEKIRIHKDTMEND